MLHHIPVDASSLAGRYDVLPFHGSLTNGGDHVFIFVRVGFDVFKVNDGDATMASIQNALAVDASMRNPV